MWMGAVDLRSVVDEIFFLRNLDFHKNVSSDVCTCTEWENNANFKAKFYAIVNCILKWPLFAVSPQGEI